MAYCENCGTELSDQAVACTNCGHATRAGLARQVPAPAGTDGAATASLVLGIVAVVLVWTWIVTLVCGILAIVFGNQAKNRIAANPAIGGAGMAKAGVVLGWVSLGLLALFIVLLVIAASSDSGFYWNF